MEEPKPKPEKVKAKPAEARAAEKAAKKAANRAAWAARASLKPKKPIKPAVPYSPEIADEICERIALGESLSTICAEEGMPRARAVMRWQREREEFERALDLARQHRADSRI